MLSSRRALRRNAVAAMLARHSFSTLPTRSLGRTGLQVSFPALGGVGLGGVNPADLCKLPSSTTSSSMLPFRRNSLLQLGSLQMEGYPSSRQWMLC